jgi:hypothetical protein
MNNHPHRPVANLSHYQKSICHAGVKILRYLSFRLRSVGNEEAQYNSALIRYVNTNTF